MQRFIKYINNNNMSMARCSSVARLWWAHFVIVELWPLPITIKLHAYMQVKRDVSSMLNTPQGKVRFHFSAPLLKYKIFYRQIIFSSVAFKCERSYLSVTNQFLQSLDCRLEHLLETNVNIDFALTKIMMMPHFTKRLQLVCIFWMKETEWY